MAEEEEIQQPEKPTKKKKSSGGLSLPIMIAIGAGTLIVLVGASLFAINYMVNNIIDKKLGAVQADSTQTHTKEDEHAKKEKEKSKEIDETYKELEEEEYFETEEGVEYMETDRIVTNPKFSTRFAVLKLGLSYRIKVNDEEEEKEEEEVEGEDPKVMKMQAQIRNIINNMIGSMTEEELQQNRQNLQIIVKEKLTPIFKKHKMFLRDVLIVEFIIQ
jgi:hypothetical protein